MQQVNNALKQAAQAGYIESEEDGLSDEEKADEWGGFQDTPVRQDLVDHEEEYVDEDRFTTVTVESVNISKDGLTSSRPDEEDSADERGGDKNTQAQPERTDSEKNEHATKKKKKQRFRYESKLERQITTIKEKARNKRRPRD